MAKTCMKRLLSIALSFSLILAPLSGADSMKMSDADVEVVTEAAQQNSMLLQLKQKLAQAQYRYYLMQNNIERAKEGLVEIHEVVRNLEEVVANLKLNVKDTDKKILSVKSQKERKKMDLRELETEVERLETQLDVQKQLVGDLMALLYMKRGVYYDEDKINAVKVLASPNSVSETLQSLTYLDIIEEENQLQIQKMLLLQDEVSELWQAIRQKNDELDTLDKKLASELSVQEEELIIQDELLHETKAQALIFSTMIASSDQHEDELLREIEILERNVKVMAGEYAGTQVLLSDEQQSIIERIEDEKMENFDLLDAAQFNDFDWPVDPSRGLTAFFTDSGYYSRFGVQHYALDIRAEQGSSIFAPADGVVTDVVYDETSTSYAYVMVTHRKGVSSVYGHVSAVAVAPGDFVTRGQLLGFTGGAVGGIGTGGRSTGPHLHVEFWQDGAPVDPLRYLPLEEVPGEYLPESYLKELQGQLEEEIKAIQYEIGF